MIGAACWAASVIFFIGQAIAQAGMATPYSLTTGLISDLGNTDCGPDVCSRLYVLMDALFVTTGVLHWVGAIAVRRIWPAKTKGWIVTVLLALAGWGLIDAGLFPENRAPIQHAFGALLGLVALNVGMVAVGSAISTSSRQWSTATYIAGGVGLVGLALFLVHYYSALVPVGVAERIADYPSAVMLIVIGVFLLSKSRSSNLI